MKRLFALLLILVGIGLTGCTMTETPAERIDRYQMVNRWNARQFNEDWDYLWLYEKPMYLSPWYLRAGLPD